MLHGPKRPLPRRFSRRVTPAMKSFAKRKHSRTKEHRHVRMRKLGRKMTVTWAKWKALFRQWLFVGIGVLVAIALWVVLFSPLFTVREIRVQRGQGRVDTAAVQQTLTPLFGKHLLLVTTFDVANRVRTVVPDLASVQISKQYPSRLSLRITLQPFIAKLAIQEPKKPVALQSSTGSSSSLPTRNTGAVLVSPPRTDYLTEKGIYIATPPTQSGASLPVINVVDWVVRPVPGKLLTQPELLERMRSAEETLTREFGQKVTARTLYLRAQEFHLALGKVSIWFDLENPLKDQFNRYRVFLKNVGMKDVSQYVDLRLHGRVVYR